MTDHAFSRLIFWFCAGFYTFLSPAQIGSPDGVVMFQLARSIVEERSFAYHPLPGIESHGGQAAPDGPDGQPRNYSKYGLLPSLAGVPAYALSLALRPLTTAGEQSEFDTPAVVEGSELRAIGATTGVGDPRSWRPSFYGTSERSFGVAFGAWMVQLTSGLAGAGCAALGYLIARNLGYSRHIAVATAAVVALGSPMLCYGREYWSEPFSALCLLASVFPLAGFKPPKLAGHLAAGAFLGALTLTKTALGIFFLPFAVAYFVESGWGDLRSRSRQFSAFCLGLGLIGAIGLAYNFARFGNIFETGYGDEADRWTTPVMTGVYGLLASPGRGLLIYAPVVLPAWILIPAMWRKSRLVALLAGLGWPLLLVLYCRWWMWEGGWCWGPRFLVPLLPLSCLLLAEGFTSWKSPIQRGLLWVCVAGGIIAAAETLLVRSMDHDAWLKNLFASHEDVFFEQGLESYYDLLRWDWRFAPIVDYWAFPVKEPYLWPFALRAHGLVGGFLTAALCVAAWSALRIVRELAGPTGRSSRREPGLSAVPPPTATPS